MMPYYFKILSLYQKTNAGYKTVIISHTLCDMAIFLSFIGICSKHLKTVRENPIKETF